MSQFAATFVQLHSVVNCLLMCISCPHHSTMLSSAIYVEPALFSVFICRDSKLEPLPKILNLKPFHAVSNLGCTTQSDVNAALSSPQHAATSFCFSIFAARWFNKERYACHPIAMTPANKPLSSTRINAKLNAVTAGQTFQLFTQLVGNVCLILSKTSCRLAPLSALCMPKKYELNMGVKTI